MRNELEFSSFLWPDKGFEAEDGENECESESERAERPNEISTDYSWSSWPQSALYSGGGWKGES